VPAAPKETIYEIESERIGRPIRGVQALVFRFSSFFWEKAGHCRNEPA
jgi:hypothetical protein